MLGKAKEMNIYHCDMKLFLPNMFAEYTSIVLVQVLPIQSSVLNGLGQERQKIVRFYPFLL